MSNNDERLSKVNANDRRVKRTKKLLRDSLFSLLQEKSINEITVTELTDVADINRATFYFVYRNMTGNLISDFSFISSALSQLMAPASNSMRLEHTVKVRVWLYPETKRLKASVSGML